MSTQSYYNGIVILGPTASGKTKLAVEIAKLWNAEIISADSRQVYKDLTIGTGKDLKEYETISYHLIDIVSPNDYYNLAQFQTDFSIARNDIQLRNKNCILCGGTGLYIEAVLKDFTYSQIPVNESLRAKLILLTHDDLIDMIKKHASVLLYKEADTSTHKRCIRILEILDYLSINHFSTLPNVVFKPLIIGLNPELTLRRQKIKERLITRLEEGFLEEIIKLLNQGISTERLIYMGLEYKFGVEYLQKKVSYSEFVERLTIAIQQFAKRQMTYFRKIEREGFEINWIDNQNHLEKSIEILRKNKLIV